MSNRPARGKARIQAKTMAGLKAEAESLTGLYDAKCIQVKRLKRILKSRDQELTELEDLCELHESQIKDYREEVKSIKDKARNNIFYMPDYSIKASSIETVQIFRGKYNIGAAGYFTSPKVVVNAQIYEHEQAKNALKALYACGYYTDQQFQSSIALMLEYIDQHEQFLSTNP